MGDINTEYKKIIESESSTNEQKQTASRILTIIDEFIGKGEAGH